jgi:hypothetical protein
VNADIFERLQNSTLAVAVSENWFPWIESAHVIALAMVAGTIFVVDTRLIGLTSLSLRFSYVSDRLLPWTWGAFIGAAITGTLMFMAGATSYVDNNPLLFKLGLIVLAGVNMAYFQFVTYRTIARWDSGRPPAAARTAGYISLALWIAIIACGRWIGFV